MRASKRYIALLGLIALIAAGCGGGDDGGDNGDGQTTTTAESMDDDTTTTAASNGGSSPEVGEFGSFTVNDTEFAVTGLLRCIPFQDEPGDIDLQALGQRAQLNLEFFGGDRTDVSVQGGAIRDEFGSIAFGSDVEVSSSDISGDRWTGTATAGDSTGGDGTVDITWDVMIPEEIRDCSL